MADNYKISYTLETLQKAVEIIDRNMHEVKTKLQAPNLYLDPFKFDTSNNELGKVHQDVVTLRDSVLTLLKQVKEKTEDWQQLNENIIKSNVTIRDELKHVERKLAQYGYTPLNDVEILEVSSSCKQGIKQDLSTASFIEKEPEICLMNDIDSNDTLVTPMLCRRSKSQRSLEKELKSNLLETSNMCKTSKVVPQPTYGYIVNGHDREKESVSNVKHCDLGANMKQKELEDVKEGMNEENDDAEGTTSGCGKYSRYYSELMKTMKDEEQSNVNEETSKYDSYENETPGDEDNDDAEGSKSGCEKYSRYYYELMKTLKDKEKSNVHEETNKYDSYENGKYSVYYYELMKKSGKNLGQ